MEDDAEAAEKTFDEAISIAKRLLRDALLGRAAALEELDRRTEAFDCLAAARWLDSANGPEGADDLGDILRQWETLARPRLAASKG